MKSDYFVFSITIFLFLGLPSLVGQSNPGALGQGLNLDQEGMQYDSLLKIPESFGSKSDELPFDKSLRAFCPKPMQQGITSTCVAWTAGYGAMTILYAQQMDWPKEKITDRAFSGMYIYKDIHQNDCSGGATLSDAATFLKEAGDCRSIAFDSDLEDCNRYPDEQQIFEAKQHRLKDFAALFDNKDKVRKKDLWSSGV